MDIPTTWIFGAGGLVLGAALSWAVNARLAAQREARLAAAARDQVAHSTQGIRAAYAKLQADSEKEKAASLSGPQQELEQQRQLVQRLQAQLRAANAEIDRLQPPPAPAAPTPGMTMSIAPGILLPEDQVDPDGFAMTRPFER